jgi:radical SAM protein with 4Fe4S-binding SPASM domain
VRKGRGGSIAAHGTRRYSEVESSAEGAGYPDGPRCARLERLDPETLDLIADAVDVVAIAFESHLDELATRVRPADDPVEARERLRGAIELCRERRLTLEVEVPLAVENVVAMPRTIEWLGGVGVERVSVVPHPPRSQTATEADPFTCLSSAYLERMMSLTRQSARASGVELVWEPREGRTFGLDALPGFCEEAWGRVSVGADGTVSACALGPPGDLELGRLADGTLEEIWNDTAARDLRRAHRTWDYPRPCFSCPRIRGPTAARSMPFMERFMHEFAGGAEPAPSIEPIAPGRLVRRRTAPVVRVLAPGIDWEHWYLVLARGGAAEACEALLVEPAADRGGIVTLDLPELEWRRLEPNTGYWWAVFAAAPDGRWAGMPTARCLVRHEAVPRVEESPLAYPCEDGDPMPGPLLSPRLSREDYGALVRRVTATVSAVLPRGAVAAVITKGDDRLLDIAGIEGRHFPCGGDGGYLGYHPPDGAWAAAHLDAMRSNGVDHLVIPATAFWWNDRYPAFAAHLHQHCALLLDERDTCVVFALNGGCR